MTERHKEERTQENNHITNEFLDFTKSDKEPLRQSLDQAEKEHKSNVLERAAFAKATELAEKAHANEHLKHRNVKKEEQRRGAPSKKQLQETFNAEMKNIYAEMSTTNRIISRVIHNPLIEKTTDFIGTTLARPNAMLSGSIAAFASITIIYLVARHYGYRLSGFETIAAFIIGWAIGILYDYIAGFIRRHKS